jgi:hypothetical protein
VISALRKCQIDAKILAAKRKLGLEPAATPVTSPVPADETESAAAEVLPHGDEPSQADDAAADPVSAAEASDPLGALGGGAAADDGEHPETGNGGSLADGLAAFASSATTVAALMDDDDDGSEPLSPSRRTSTGKILAKSKGQTVGEERKLKRKQSTLTVNVDPARLVVPLELRGNPFLDADACHKCHIPFDFIALRQ